jgi:hypothetical protein
MPKEINLDPLNPFVQLIGLFFSGWIIGLFVMHILQWVIWLGGGGVWTYYNFFTGRTEKIRKDNK